MCVPDAAIESATRLVIAWRRRRCRVDAGSVSCCIQAASTAAESWSRHGQPGASVASVHPLMTFPTRKRVALEGVPFAVEADGGIRAKLFRLVRRLGGKPFSIPAEGKVLYHATAVMASPLLVSLASATEEMARLGGLSAREAKALLQPIMTATLANLLPQGTVRKLQRAVLPWGRADRFSASCGAHVAS